MTERQLPAGFDELESLLSWALAAERETNGQAPKLQHGRDPSVL
jgi:hypothetical protein